MSLRVALALIVLALAAPGAARAAQCPQALRPFAAAPPTAEREQASRVAVRFARETYARKAGLLTQRMGVSELRWAPEWPPAHFLLTACGRPAWAATVVVTVVFPVMYDEPPRPFRGCRFCAGVVVLVARGLRGWFVWDAL